MLISGSYSYQGLHQTALRKWWSEEHLDKISLPWGWRHIMLSLRLFNVPNQTISYASVLDSIHHAQIRSCPVDITHCVTVQRWESHLLTGMIAPHTPTGSCLVKHKKLSSGEKQKSLTEISKISSTLSIPLIHNLTQNHTKTSICLVINIFIMGVNILPWIIIIYFFCKGTASCVRSSSRNSSSGSDLLHCL